LCCLFRILYSLAVQPDQPSLTTAGGAKSPSETPSGSAGATPTAGGRPKSALFAQFEKSGMVMGFGGPLPPGGIKALKKPSTDAGSGEAPAPSAVGGGSSATLPIEVDEKGLPKADIKPLQTLSRATGPKRRPPTRASLSQLTGGGSGDMLLAWCRSRTEKYSNVSVTNFTSSWANGLALWYYSLARNGRKRRAEGVLTLDCGRFLGIVWGPMRQRARAFVPAGPRYV